MRRGCSRGVDRFNADDDARVLVLTGAGDQAFCAGADLKEMAEPRLEVPPPDYVPIFGRNVEVDEADHRRGERRRVRGGFLLAQMCDLCVAADHARFAITEVRRSGAARRGRRRCRGWSRRGSRWSSS